MRPSKFPEARWQLLNPLTLLSSPLFKPVSRLLMLVRVVRPHCLRASVMFVSTDNAQRLIKVVAISQGGHKQVGP